MANFRKSFNLRNGVQVDDDNFIVNANGLVGIGTSVPTEFLDVRGNTKVVGVVTANSIFTPSANVTGVATITQLNVGVVTSASGLTTYYGDGRFLQGLPTSQWIDTDVGLGYTSIYAAGNVGVATTDPRYSFQIGGNPDSNSGVGFNSTGSIKVSGIITATTFSGNLSGNVTGNISGNVTGNVNSSGVSTFTKLLVGTAITATSGVVTATTFSGNLTGNVTGNLTGNATGLSGTPNINVGIVTASKIIADVVEVPNTGITTISKLLHVGTGGTAFSALESGRIGIGTAVPTSELQIRKASGSLLEVISSTGNARISVGQSVGVGKSTGVIRFGDTNQTLDIINNDTGNLNYYLHAGPAGIGTGRFEWIYGQTNVQLMSLTHGGSLGLGKTNPDNTLHVVGTTTVTGNAYFGSDVIITGNLLAGTISLPSLITETNIFNTSGISTFNDLRTTGNISVGSSISIGGITNPIASIDARNQIGLFGSIGVGTDKFYGSESFGISGTTLITEGGVGIGTTYYNPSGAALQIYAPLIDLNGGHLNIKSDNTIGFNTGSPRAIIDFGNVGSATTRPVIVVPNISASTRNGIGQTPAGSTILNTTANELQSYINNSWTSLGIQTAIINSNSIKVGTGVSIGSGIVTATSGFLSGVGTAVQITTVGNKVVFTVPGVGTTSLTLF